MKVEKQQTKFPGFTPEGQFWQFPVMLDDFVKQIDPSSFKVLWYIMRHTYGWQKEEDYASLRLIQRDTGLSRPTVIKAVGILEAKNFITASRAERTNKYKLVVNNFNHPSKKCLPFTSKKDLPTIYNSTINNKTIDNIIPLQKISDDERQRNLKKLAKMRASLIEQRIVKR